MHLNLGEGREEPKIGLNPSLRLARKPEISVAFTHLLIKTTWPPGLTLRHWGRQAAGYEKIALVYADISLQTGHSEGMSDTGYVGIVWQVKWFALTDISFSIRDNQMLFWNACTLAPYQLLKFFLL